MVHVVVSYCKIYYMSNCNGRTNFSLLLIDHSFFVKVTILILYLHKKKR